MCVCVCLRVTVTCELDDRSPINLARWFNSTLAKSSLNIKVMGQSSRSRRNNVVIWNEGATSCGMPSVLSHSMLSMSWQVPFSVLKLLTGWHKWRPACEKLLKYHHHHHNRFTALFPGTPGWAGARRELLDFMVQGEINRGRHTDHLAGRNSIQTNQCPPPPFPPIFFMGRMPFLLPNQQHQSTEGN